MIDPLRAETDRWPKQLGKALALLRVAGELTQEELARLSKLRNSSISDYERAKIVPGAKILAQILLAMDMPFEALDRTLGLLHALERLRGKGRSVLENQGLLPRPSPGVALRDEIEALALDFGRVLVRTVRLSLLLLARLRLRDDELALAAVDDHPRLGDTT